MKPCPFCAELIQDDAKKCRFCGEWLELREETTPRPEGGGGTAGAQSQNSHTELAAESRQLRQAEEEASTNLSGEESGAGAADVTLGAAAESVAASTPASAHERLRGVGGWLLLFCVGLTILSPIVTFSNMRQAWEDSSPAFNVVPALRPALIFENLFLSAIVLYGITVGARIWAGSLDGASLAKRYLWLRLATMVGGEGIVITMLSGAVSAAALRTFAAAVGGRLIIEFLFFGIWYSYFRRSKRVRITYADHGAGAPSIAFHNQSGQHRASHD